METAIASQVALDASVEELFPSIYEKVSTAVIGRARVMLKQLPEASNDPKTELKRKQLERIINGRADDARKNVWKAETTNSPAS